jgi:predicted ATP-grasp superfamily ATP-dependent carboligase
MGTSLRTLIVIGASARAVGYSVLRAGYQPYAIDLFADRDLAAIGRAVKIARYPHDFLAALAAAPNSAWLYTGGLENYPQLVNRLAVLRPLAGNRGDVLRKVREMALLAAVVHEAGCRFPAGLPFQAEDRSLAPSQWLVKPRRSSGGVAVRFATDRDLARPPRGTYLQQYIPGDGLSAVFVAAGGRAVLLGATKQLVGRDFQLERPFLYVGSVGPVALDDEALAQVRWLGNVLAERFGLAGLFNVDLIRNSDGLWALEVNPRYSASVEALERASGFHSIDLHLAACEAGRLPEPGLLASEQCVGKAVVYAMQDGAVPSRFDAVMSEWNSDAARPGLADLPRVGERIRRGQPVVTVFASGQSLSAVEVELRRRFVIIQGFLAGS